MTVTKPPRHMSVQPYHNFDRMLDRALASRYLHDILSRRPRLRPVENRDSNGLLKPRVDLLDDPEKPHITCQVEVPGLKKDDVSLLIQNGNLTISGERRSTITPSPRDSSEPAPKYILQEVKYGKFHREVALPPDLRPTEISASMMDGMLTITWPRTSIPAELPKRIEVQGQ